jgi:hypothetical protein
VGSQGFRACLDKDSVLPYNVTISSRLDRSEAAEYGNLSSTDDGDPHLIHYPAKSREANRHQ